MQSGRVLFVFQLVLVFTESHRGWNRGRRPGGHHGHGKDHDHHHKYGSKCKTSQFRGSLKIRSVNEVKKVLINDLFDARSDRYAHVVRAAFHDCVGGCDGCINRNNPGNAGPMLETLDAMDKIYDAKAKKLMSRADFYVLTAITGLEESLKFNNRNLRSNYIRPVKFKFRYGRCDCQTSPTTNVDRTFPGGEFGYDEVMDYLNEEFGLNQREVVALMGAHTLGGASGAKGSGFQGFWKEGATAAARLNNRYYSLLVDQSLRWKHVDQAKVTGSSTSKWQWQAGTTSTGVPAPFMLNADVSLYKRINPDSSGKSSCQFRSCSLSPSGQLVKKYASNGDVWLKDFAKAFEKMTRKGARRLKMLRYF